MKDKQWEKKGRDGRDGGRRKDERKKEGTIVREEGMREGWRERRKEKRKKNGRKEEKAARKKNLGWK